jgi:hypothetical protein
MFYRRFTIIILAHLLLAGCGGGGGGGGVSLASPTVSLSSSSSSGRVGDVFTLTWSSRNATSCSASGGWSGSKGLSGTENITVTTSGSKTYTLNCSGSGGTGSANASIEVRKAIIPIDLSDLRYRTPDPGDLIAYNYTRETKSISGSVALSTSEDSGTVDLEYFRATLTGEFGQAWSDFDIMLEQASYSSGEINSNIYAYDTRVLNVADQESYFVSIVDGVTYYGSTYHPTLESGTSFTEEYQVYYDDNSFRKFGETTFSVSSTEILETEIGDVEVFKYTTQEKWTYAEYFISSWQPREAAELSITVWIHPHIGMLKVEGLAKFDDTPNSAGSYVETKLDLKVRSVNFVLPN